MNKQVAEHVQRAVSVLLTVAGPDASPAEVHAALWPYVSDAVTEERAERGEAPPPRGDRRSKPWQVVVRFWNAGPTDPELIAETDPLVVEGTGELTSMLPDLATQLYDAVPEALSEDAVKARLPQLRNNLGRAKSAVLRIDFEIPGTGSRGICQADVFRLDQ